jgi:hypothetical protein
MNKTILEFTLSGLKFNLRPVVIPFFPRTTHLVSFTSVEHYSSANNKTLESIKFFGFMKQVLDAYEDESSFYQPDLPIIEDNKIKGLIWNSMFFRHLENARHFMDIIPEKLMYFKLRNY